ncbi:putative MFS transporter [Calycina marina]|uniref:MFS transporter n=1 Tax=Calycina marina TaxID=1763456 RepID=A0A9P7ZB88_9HELO|nr:putative MFS transporter [Calycina marina]
MSTTKEEELGNQPVQENDAPVVEKNAEVDLERATTQASVEAYSIYTKNEKIFLAAIASLAALFSPLTANIYYSALNTLATDFHTSLSNISLSITTYLIFQGLAPTIVGSISDDLGRRPMYLACFVIYIAANIGLALQNKYAGLLVIRMLQSAGSSGTIALANALVADVVTSAERGSYMGYVSMGALTGPAFGPAIGGLLDKYLGWRAIFWFLAIISGVVFVIIFFFLPETCRKVVGNGSVAPPLWNTSVLSYMHQRRQRKAGVESNYGARDEFKRKASLISSFYILFDKESGSVLLYAGVFFTGFYMVQTGLPGTLQNHYGYSSIQIGLCYIPAGVGSMLASFLMGRLLDVNFRRHAKKIGMEISNSKQQDLRNFPIERARLEMVLPLAYGAGGTVIAFGWLLEKQVFIAAPLIFLFMSTFLISCSFQGLSTLIVDLNRDSPSAATAAMNLARCLLGAAGTAAVVPMINVMGQGWVAVFVAGMWVILSPIILMVMKWGPGWRSEATTGGEAKK